MRTNDEYRKCPECGADIEDENAGGMFCSMMKCTECDWRENDLCGCVTA